MFALVGNMRKKENFLLEGRTDVVYAYSIRDLYGTNSDVIRVIRSSDSAVSGFTETEITDGTLEDWVTVEGAQPTANGVVDIWYDQTGNGYNVTQLTESNCPTIVSSGSLLTLNGSPYLEFNSTEVLSYSGTVPRDSPGAIVAVGGTTSSTVGGYTYFSVSDSAEDDQYFIFTMQSFNDRCRLLCRPSVGGTANISEGSTLINANQQRIMCAASDGGNYLFRVDGSAETVNTIGGANNGDWTDDPPSPNRINFGALIRPSSAFINSEWQEFIMFDTEIADLTTVESSVNTYYSTY